MKKGIAALSAAAVISGLSVTACQYGDAALNATVPTTPVGFCRELSNEVSKFLADGSALTPGRFTAGNNMFIAGQGDPASFTTDLYAVMIPSTDSGLPAQSDVDRLQSDCAAVGVTSPVWPANQVGDGQSTTMTPAAPTNGRVPRIHVRLHRPYGAYRAIRYATRPR